MMQSSAPQAAIRKCVHCGFCLATCPTYVLLGDELDSPRGRIQLMKDMLDGQPPTAETVKHIDRCLSCLACITTCPSGVDYMHLIDHARAHITEHYRRPWDQRIMRTLLRCVLPYPARLKFALALAQVARPLVPVLRRIRAFAPLAAMIAMAPRRPPATALCAPSMPSGARGRVVLLQGCAEPVLRPEYRGAAIRLLERVGYEVVLAGGEGCCGALAHHMGDEKGSMSAVRRNIDAWIKHIDNGLVGIVTVTSGCGTTLKDYAHMLRGVPSYAEKAARVSALVKDISEILTENDVAASGQKSVRVAYHAACSLQHGQKVVSAPQRLLAAAGFEVLVPSEAHLCCGSAGTYNILQPEISDRLGKRKAEHLEKLGADVIAVGNVGCAVHIGLKAATPIVHVIELLDWATGGPVPPALGLILIAHSPSTSLRSRE